ncbi:MAG TPA: ribosome small subunit-dependent GTPase A [Chitinophagaceae bacterium]|nr:ribosome small subunit-dependent GTPase A [Chitinophagaceae bacterium]
MAQGVVYRSTGSWYIIKDTKGKLWNARMKGVFKIEGITSTNPIAVGDVVAFETENELESGATITKIHDRKNYINRQSPRIKYQQHIVAANVDQSIMVATIKEPRTSQGFIDRFLVVCEMYHVPAVIIFNKYDLYRQKELDQLEKFKTIYENTGYTVLPMSIKEHLGMEDVTALLQNKISLVSGHSGVGKSSFINEIIEGKNILTKQISGWSGKGQHATTFSEMHDLPFGGAVIDTPGMKEFGLVDIEKAELSGYFPEMKKLLNDCQFNNCLHMNEPGCAIKIAVMNGEIHEERYVSYCSILESTGQMGY